MQTRLARIKADILSELVAVSVVRSEFDAAEKVSISFLVLPQTLQPSTGNGRLDRPHSHMGRV
jgi:hypothetical protein